MIECGEASGKRERMLIRRGRSDPEREWLCHCGHCCNHQAALSLEKRTATLWWKSIRTKDQKLGTVPLQGVLDQYFPGLCIHRKFPTYRRWKAHGIFRRLRPLQGRSNTPGWCILVIGYADAAIALYDQFRSIERYDLHLMHTCIYMPWRAHGKSVHNPLLRRWLGACCSHPASYL